jgi:tetratricopeptide (TPR) repeat protein
VYRYERPLQLPAGTIISMDYLYDNTSDNPRNPHAPPQRVTYGQQTSDEMAELWFQVLPHSAGDRQALTSSVAAAVLPEEIAGRRMMLEKKPDDIALRNDLALLYVDAHEPDSALHEFEETLRRQPESAAAHFNVATALLSLGRQDDARRMFEQTLALDPSHAGAHSSLALILRMAGETNEALEHHRQALELAPADAEIQLNAGVDFALSGYAAEAMHHLREAVRLRPNWANAEAALASVIAGTPDASHGDRELAVTLARHAVAATGGRVAAYREILAAAETAARR